jgi:L-cysteine S-thiosulfotransferase
MLMLASSGAQGAGDATRGRVIAESRTQGLCVLCHALPGVPAAQAGTIGPNLAGIGARLSAEQLRAQLVAPQRFNAETVMPSYARSDGLTRVAAARRGQALLDAQQIDDVVAYLGTLK